MALTVGKIRGLQQISSPAGIFTMTAMDQRGSLAELMRPQNPSSVTYEELKQVKIELAAVFGPLSSAVLLDPLYGAAEAIAYGALPGRTGLLVAWEESGYTPDGSGRLTQVQPGWSVAKIKRMGASAVKLLVYYHPDEARSAEHQRAIVRQVVADCATHDIPAVVEAVTYGINGLKTGTAEFAAQKPRLVIRTAQELSPLGFDVFKAEFPADLKFESDEGKMAGWCRQLNDSCPVPWVILSAGVDISLFRKQVEIACKHGASGFLAGRAIWKDGIRIAGGAERRRWLETTGVDNLRQCIDLAQEFATPWTKKLDRSLAAAADVSEGWLQRYPSA
ncbi:MAG: tagatose 1,6-diphosphate aldolase [Chloroflexi bacterium]|nr:tagatose 1,6-diphosphate aldolase [Chloroflexota bacterium]